MDGRKELEPQETKSAVARLLAQIDAEFEAAERGLYGLAQGTARHDFITKRTETIAHCYKELQTLMIGDEAMPLIAPHSEQKEEPAREKSEEDKG